MQRSSRAQKARIVNDASLSESEKKLRLQNDAIRQLIGPGPWRRCFTLYVLGLGTALIFMRGIWFMHSTLPPIPSNSLPEQFAETNALVHLKTLSADIGVRVCGTKKAAEAADYIVKVLDAIQAQSNPGIHVELDVQRAPGALVLPRPKNTRLVLDYADVTNILVRISSRNDSSKKHALLVSSHFDSAIDSPGASDAATPIAVMLEMVRALAAGPSHFAHAVIFNFNGDEEYIMAGAHAFITQHSWAQSVRAFINLESMGIGGRELLFQIRGRNSLWLANAYKESVQWPSASVFAQELFEGGITSSDTDSRIYHTYGNLSGIDMAYVRGGYWYHTPLDSIAKIPKGTLQVTGMNTLALVARLANSSDLPSGGGTEEQSSAVFFDVAGWRTIVFGAPLGASVVRWSSLLSCLAVAFGLFFDFEYRDARPSIALLTRGILPGFLSVVGSWLAGIAFPVAIALFVTYVMGNPLAWYANQWLVGTLYVTSTLAASLFIQWWRHAFNTRVVSRIVRVDTSLGSLVFWLVLANAMVHFGIRCSYMPLAFIVPLSMTLFNGAEILASTHASKADKDDPGAKRGLDWAWVPDYIICTLVPSLATTPATMGLIDVLLPLLGRAGHDSLSEVKLAAAVAVVTLMHITPFFPYCHMYNEGFTANRAEPTRLSVVNRTENFQYIVMFLLIAVLASLIVVPFLSPYSSLFPKRVILQQTIHYDRGGTGSVVQSYMLAVGMDATKGSYVQSALEDTSSSDGKPIATLPLSLVPTFRHTAAIFPFHLLIPSAWQYALPIPEDDSGEAERLRPMLTITEDNYDTSKRVRTFTLAVSTPGTTMSTLEFDLEKRPLISWSLDGVNPQMASDLYDKRVHAHEYLIRHVGGASSQWNITLSVKTSKDAPISFVLSTTHHSVRTDPLVDARRRLPSWMTAVGWVSAYSYWTL